MLSHTGSADARYQTIKIKDNRRNATRVRSCPETGSGAGPRVPQPAGGIIYMQFASAAFPPAVAQAAFHEVCLRATVCSRR